jgi:hypothetical protein
MVETLVDDRAYAAVAFGQSASPSGIASNGHLDLDLAITDDILGLGQAPGTERGH